MTPSGERIREFRRALGMTQKEFATMLRLSGVRYIRMLENGQRKPSGLLVLALELIARTKRVSVPWQ